MSLLSNMLKAGGGDGDVVSEHLSSMCPSNLQHRILMGTVPNSERSESFSTSHDVAYAIFRRDFEVVPFSEY